jgi:hypothetical protein
VRVNRRTATIGPGTGGTWRVPFHILRHVLDICVALNSGSGKRQEGLGAAPTTGNAHDHEHQRGGQAVVTTELLPDGHHVPRREREELLPIKLTQARRQGPSPTKRRAKAGMALGHDRWAVNVPPGNRQRSRAISLRRSRRPATSMDTGLQAEAHQSARKVRLPLVAMRRLPVKATEDPSDRPDRRDKTPFASRTAHRAA